MFSAQVYQWFKNTFDQPTEVQSASWAAIDSGQDVLISAPTGSGKTFAAFLYAIDRLHRLDKEQSDSLRVIYVSPLKALSNDIQINLQQPLSELNLGAQPAQQVIRAEVWTGDTSSSDRNQMRKKPPHILVTTPESLFNIITSISGRSMMREVDTVIIDEVHAMAGNKRGAHLLLTLKRLEALSLKRPQRIAISATQKPIERMRDFILHPDYSQIVNLGHRRTMQISIELTQTPLSAVPSAQQWSEIYDHLQQNITQHQTTLIFVNNRRLAERVCRHLAERMDESLVAAHHGSLSKEHRLNVEQRLKDGALKALVATSSLELGIDIGDIDLVCQIGSPGSIQAFLQRVGRSGHRIDKTPKGQLYPTTLDDLVEMVAIEQAIVQGQLESTHFSDQPLDVLAQHIVAEVSLKSWPVQQLYHLLSDNYCYKALTFQEFESVVDTLSQGFTGAATPQKALLFYDRVAGMIKGKKSAQLTALLNGGTIPDQFDYDVRLLPEDIKIGSLNEDFSFESIPGDIFQLGNHSYRILKVKTGTVFVEDAKGMPPNIPFWFGVQMWRSDELSQMVSQVRELMHSACESRAVKDGVKKKLNLTSEAFDQLMNYAEKTHQVLSVFPSQKKVVFERFFDGNDDMHVVIHSNFGSRLNRAWGLALRKRFCRQFNFELQAAALEDSIILSLGATHSFELSDVIHYLKPESLKEVLIQALLDTPFFVSQWRWNASIALAVKRRYGGKRVLPQFQRNAAEDLVAQIFPEQIACAENIQGKRAIPDHPLVHQTIKDCTEVMMDIVGLEQLITKINQGLIEVVCVDSNTPSPASMAIINARNYAFLDEAPAEERRVRAVKTQNLNADFSAGVISQPLIDKINAEIMPTISDTDECLEFVSYVGFVCQQFYNQHANLMDDLVHNERVIPLDVEDNRFYIAAQNKKHICAMMQGLDEIPLDSFVANRLAVSGHTKFSKLLRNFPVSSTVLNQSLLRLQSRGVAFVLPNDVWMNRENLARLRRRALHNNRQHIKTVGQEQWQYFIDKWQFKADPLSGVEGLQRVLTQLQGMSSPAHEWEKTILPSRVVDYAPYMLDQLCQNGLFLWKRTQQTVAASTMNLRSLQKMPMTFVQPEYQGLYSPTQELTLSQQSQDLLAALDNSGALFVRELLDKLDMPVSHLEQALIQLIRQGKIVADGFAAIRSLMMSPADRFRHLKKAGKKTSGLGYLEMMGRWSVIQSDDVGVEKYADLLIRRFGVLTYELFRQEWHPLSWREVLYEFNRLEARGELLAGRFLHQHSGMQYALPEAYEELKCLS